MQNLRTNFALFSERAVFSDFAIVIVSEVLSCNASQDTLDKISLTSNDC